MEKIKATKQAIADNTPDFTKAVEELCIIAEQNKLKLERVEDYKKVVGIFYKSCIYN